MVRRALTSVHVIHTDGQHQLTGIKAGRSFQLTALACRSLDDAAGSRAAGRRRIDEFLESDQTTITLSLRVRGSVLQGRGQILGKR